MAPLPHDPLVCGIYAESSCPACRAAMDAGPELPPHTARWAAIRRAYPELAAIVGRHVPPDAPPPADMQMGILLIGTLTRYPWLAEALVAAAAPALLRLHRAAERRSP